ncbi:tetratricopeptide repeat protein [Acanthopleuribacter pedis]|uniref:Tetratricopeptide repeat protein n=1 Tax=Acanthopleuribacter pedis TaxID=442870 RepID=A0A8J7QKS5_9BACT|nr:tetratricopeptide repeat protein [Acanthopleuribacter pedis]MBO1320048.1 tetratricopeptide repeat protein [Acanthopleuribacter pedis]
MTSPLYRTLAQLTRKALASGQLTEAQELIVKLKDEDSLALETRGLELELAIKSGNLRDAGILATQLVQLFPASSRIQFLTGRLEYQRKRYGKAEQHFTESHHIFPSKHTQHWLGKTLTQAGKLDEALAILEPLAHEENRGWSDLAWLYERRGQWDKALAAYEKVLAKNPEDAYAKNQIVRLRAKTLAPQDLIEECNDLIELGEPLPDHLLPDYLTALFKTGHGDRARAVIETNQTGWDTRLTLKVAWLCYTSQVFDQAYPLFLRCLPSNLNNFKLLNALEKAATKTNRRNLLIEQYKNLADQEKSLYGRIKKLEKDL